MTLPTALLITAVIATWTWGYFQRINFLAIRRELHDAEDHIAALEEVRR